MRRITWVLAAVALAAAAPLGSMAHDGHCKDPFMLTGVDPGDGNRQGTNLGAITCQVDNDVWSSSPAHVDTNIVIPGSTHLWVALFNSFNKPTNSTITVGSGPSVPLTFTDNDVRGRWESQSIDLAGLPAGTVITARVRVADATTPAHFQEISYTTAI